MHTPKTFRALSRRSALAGLGVGGFGSVLARKRAASAQDATMAAHPIVGVWMVTTPAGPALAVFLADGTNIQGLPATQAGPQGVEYVSTQVGTWEPAGERGVHFTGVQLHSDADGTLLGTVMIDGHPVVSDDGMTLLDDNPMSGAIIRDAAGAIVADLRGSGGPPVTGVRMAPGNPGFPAGNNATPVS